jgi:hypothetical protein
VAQTDADNPDVDLKGWDPAEEKAARAGLRKAYGWFGLVVAHPGP